MPEGSRAPPKAGKCPICSEPSETIYRPFCSRRCANIDLGRWLTGSYVISGGNDDADEDGDGGSPAPDQDAKEP